MIIGLTGGSGTGKSSAGQFFKDKGFMVIDMDKLSRNLCEKGQKCLEELVCEFGDDILDKGGNLKRHYLGDIVFNDEKKLQLLNGITHKYIIAETDKIISENTGSNIVLDAPLLFEAGLESRCDKTLAVLSNREIRTERLKKRDSLTHEQVVARLDSQPSDDFYIKKCDVVVFNNSDFEALYKSLEKEFGFLNEK